MPNEALARCQFRSFNFDDFDQKSLTVGDIKQTRLKRKQEKREKSQKKAGMEVNKGFEVNYFSTAAVSSNGRASKLMKSKWTSILFEGLLQGVEIC